jgi:diguanylate cyclase (GGDEF)-like protein
VLAGDVPDLEELNVVGRTSAAQAGAMKATGKCAVHVSIISVFVLLGVLGGVVFARVQARASLSRGHARHTEMLLDEVLRIDGFEWRAIGGDDFANVADRFSARAKVLREILADPRYPESSSVQVSVEGYIQSVEGVFEALAVGHQIEAGRIAATRGVPLYEKAMYVARVQQTRDIKNSALLESRTRLAGRLVSIFVMTGLGAICAIAFHFRERRKVERCAAAQLERELLHRAYHDPLTGLATRPLLLERAERALLKSARSREPVSMLYCDLDNFKCINDTLGHRAGDELLGVVVARISGCLRPTDTFARLGGDEFAVLIEEADVDTAVAIGQRIVDIVSLETRLNDEVIVPSVSVGLATALGEIGSAELLHNADVAMYAAKHSGRGQFVSLCPWPKSLVAATPVAVGA